VIDVKEGQNEELEGLGEQKIIPLGKIDNL
jgi:hypothetical protein